MWQMICLPPRLSPLVTHPPQMRHIGSYVSRCVSFSSWSTSTALPMHQVCWSDFTKVISLCSTHSAIWASSWSYPRSFFISCGKCHFTIVIFPLWYMLFFMKSSLKVFSFPWFVVVFWM
jgi:hypothetical protein